MSLSQREKAKGAVSASFAVFDTALASGKLPAEGKVGDRLVRSAFAALGRSAPELRIEHVENPFTAPHNLSWYFGVCACPGEIRQFVTMLGRKHLRVWSVASDEEGWHVLIQVFGVKGKGEAVKAVELEMQRPQQRLKGWTATADGYSKGIKKINEFIGTRLAVPEEFGNGSFVEVLLRRGVV